LKGNGVEYARFVAVANDPLRWRQRAKEARALADELDDAEARESLLRIADIYEDMEGKAATQSARKYAAKLVIGS
jgi:hypothetical protein